MPMAVHGTACCFASLRIAVLLNRRPPSKSTKVHQTQNVGAERKKIGGGTGGCDHCGLCLLERFFIVALDCLHVHAEHVFRCTRAAETPDGVSGGSAGFRVLVSPDVIEQAETGGS